MIGRRAVLLAAAVVTGSAVVGTADAAPRLSAPRGVRVTPGADGSLRVSWEPVKRAQSYQVEWVRRA